MKLYITNLSLEATDALLIDWFRRGKAQVMDCHIVRNSEMQSQRYGFVNVQDRDADQALKLSGKYMQGRAVRIKKATAKKA